MIFYAYYTSQGRYVQTGTAVTEVSNFDIPAGCSVYYGVADAGTQYHDAATNSPVNKGMPPADGYDFDYATKTWQPNLANLGAAVRYKRDQLLQASDWTQIPNNPLVAEQQTVWATYRQELRDIPAQSGYPINVVWPTPPA